MECAMMPPAPTSSRARRRGPRLWTPTLRASVLAAACLGLGSGSAPALADPIYPHVPCYTGADAKSYAQYPPECPRGFTSHDGVLLIANGLPPGSSILGRLSFSSFTNLTETLGGPLGGEITLVDATARLDMRGTGFLAFYSRTLFMPVTMVLHTGPQNTLADARTFPVDVDQLQGQLFPGDPDFDLLRLTAGTGFGMPSPGRATVTRDHTGEFLMDSFWDLTYRVDFVGAPGGPFAGMSGSTTSEHRQRAGMHTNKACNLPDNGTGTADWTPFCAGWETKTETLLYDDGAGTFLIGDMARRPPGGLALAPGGPYGGEQATDIEDMRLVIVGEGALAGFNRVVGLPNQAQHDLGPVMTGTPFQGRISDPTFLFAQIVGDPDFDLLRVGSGTALGFPTRGHTTLTRDGAGDWMLDSFFDITYRVDFVGAPGGPLAGLSGSTIGDARGQAGRERPGYCLQPDNGTGTAGFPPFCSPGYRSPRHLRGMLNGMPAGSPVLVDIEILPMTLVSTAPGGPLGGETQTWDARVAIEMTGTGLFLGYSRAIWILATVGTATAPVTPGTTPQHFETDLTDILGALPPGDPDFDLLRITGGTSFGMPSPGHTSLTHAGGSDWNVDSFFDITYRIDFIGAPGGPFAGMSGSTNDRQRFLNGDHPTLATPPGARPVAISVSPARPNPARDGAAVTLSLPRRSAVRFAVHDVAGRLVRIVEDGTREAGVYTLAWDGRGASGGRVGPGLHLLRVDAGGARFTRRVIVTR
jgi:hypothetical protein